MTAEKFMARARKYIEREAHRTEAGYDEPQTAAKIETIKEFVQFILDSEFHAEQFEV